MLYTAILPTSPASIASHYSISRLCDSRPPQGCDAGQPGSRPTPSHASRAGLDHNTTTTTSRTHGLTAMRALTVLLLHPHLSPGQARRVRLYLVGCYRH